MLPEAEKIVERFMREERQRFFEEGRAAEKATDVLEVLDARGLVVTDAQRERILGCTDLEMLARWVRRAATVSATDALFE